MKLKNIFSRTWSIMALASIVLTMGACTEEAEYNAAEMPSGIQAYFSNSLVGRVELSKTESSFAVTVSRSTSDDPAIINLTSTCNMNGYDIPGTVSFKQGESTASIVIGYNNRQDYEKWATITLTVGDKESTTPYGDTSYTFKVGIPAPWTSIGKATFCDGLISGSYGLPVIPYSVEIQENDLKKGLYRLVEPWGETAPHYNLGAYDNSVPRYLEINACDPEAVYIPVQQTGFMLSNEEGFITVMSAAGYFMENQGNTLEECKQAGVCGTLENGIITFPNNGLLLQIALGIFYGDPESTFKLALPGVEIKDYLMSVSYKGILTDPDNVKSVLADIKLGEDTDLARVAIISQRDDVYEAIDAIESGELETTEFYESGEISLKCPSAPGDYFILAVSYAGGEAREAAVDGFKVKGDGKIAKLEDFLGDYTVKGVYDDIDPETGEYIMVEDEFPVKFVKGTEELTDGSFVDVVRMEGLLGMDSYTSPVSFLFNPDEGTLEMKRFLCEQFDTGNAYGLCDVMFTPTDPEGYLLQSGDRVFGELDSDGNVRFVNSSKNKRKYDTMVFLLVTDWDSQDGVMLFSPFYDLNFNPYTPETQSNATRARTSMKFTRNHTKQLHMGNLDKQAVKHLNVKGEKSTSSVKGKNRITVRGLNTQPKLTTTQFK